MTSSAQKNSNVVNLKRWQADQKEIQAQKKRIARFRRYCYLSFPTVEEWEQDLAALTEELVREWAHKLVFGGPIPAHLRGRLERRGQNIVLLSASLAAAYARRLAEMRVRTDAR